MTTPIEVIAAVMAFTNVQSSNLEKRFSAACWQARRDMNDPPAPRLANGAEPNRMEEPSESQPQAVPPGADPAASTARSVRG